MGVSARLCRSAGVPSFAGYPDQRLTQLCACGSSTSLKSIVVDPSLTPCQVEFLEVRLAEVMAYADIPPHMRPALFDMTSAAGRGNADMGAAGALLAASLSATAAAGPSSGLGSGFGAGASVQALQRLQAALWQVLDRLRQLSDGTGAACKNETRACVFSPLCVCVCVCARAHVRIRKCVQTHALQRHVCT